MTTPTEKPEKGTEAEAEQKPEILEDTPSAVQKRRDKEQADLAAKATTTKNK